MGSDGEGGEGTEGEHNGLHGDPVECEEVHGEKNNPHGAAETTHSPRQVEHADGTAHSFPDLNKSFGSFSVGSTPLTTECTSKKRHRKCRSPSMGDSGGLEAQTNENGGARNPFVELIKKSRNIPASPTPFSFSTDINKGPVQVGSSRDVPVQYEKSGELEQECGVKSRTAPDAPGPESVVEKGAI
ncbi:hypothetical protein Hanom_Chr13g01220221 [Helianthus anomalus]